MSRSNHAHAPSARRKLRNGLLAVVCGALYAQSGQAGTASGSLAVQASISATCAVNSASMDFGTYNPTLNANFDATGAISVSCTNATSYNVGLGAGAGTGATTTNRVMMSGSNTLTYQIYSDLSRTQNWGSTVGTNTVAATGTGFAQTFTAYGRITSGQTAARPGNYSDTVTVTVTY